jgi:hypothetical protein
MLESALRVYFKFFDFIVIFGSYLVAVLFLLFLFSFFGFGIFYYGGIFYSNSFLANIILIFVSAFLFSISVGEFFYTIFYKITHFYRLTPSEIFIKILSFSMVNIGYCLILYIIFNINILVYTVFSLVSFPIYVLIIPDILVLRGNTIKTILNSLIYFFKNIEDLILFILFSLVFVAVLNLISILSIEVSILIGSLLMIYFYLPFSIIYSMLLFLKRYPAVFKKLKKQIH